MGKTFWKKLLNLMLVLFFNVWEKSSVEPRGPGNIQKHYLLLLFEDNFQNFYITKSIHCGSRTVDVICFISAEFRERVVVTAWLVDLGGARA